ncbi:tyrosine-type recombinase/integrase [Deinococcus kurensis]|uniref:tyrosine-type recombinase/integrase n=1 Tax=Deinococcus kurensis TaxID=2662757 RepID=UPI001391A1CC|nr:tyrosine-type recombinase/integrase [Deinococcus kurensis]
MTLQFSASLPAPAAADLETVFGEFIRLNVNGGQASDKTRKLYLAHARAYGDWCAATGLTPLTVTHQDLLRYRSALLEQRVSLATLKLRLTVVRRLHTALQVHGLRADHPAQGVSVPRTTESDAERVAHRYLSEDKARELLNAPTHRTLALGTDREHERRAHLNRRDAAMIAVMMLQGARVGEVSAIRLSDLDLNGGTLRLRGKGGKLRTAYLIDPTLDALRAWLEVRPSGSDRLFIRMSPGAEGQPLGIRGVRKATDEYLVQVGVKRHGVSCHSLRHTFGTHARKGGATLESIRDAMGHSSVTTTEVYAQVIDARKNNAAQSLTSLAANL